MPAWRKIVFSLLVSVCVAGAADPALLRHVMPEAKVVVGVNMSQFLASSFGRFLVTQVQSSQPQLQQFTQMTGFDPLRDLSEVLIASPGNQKDNRGLVLVKGFFDRARISSMARQGGASQSYNGVEVITGKGKPGGSVAFLDNSVAVMGDEQSVRAVIDRRGAGAGPDARLRASIDRASAMYDFWAVSTVPVSDMAGKVPSGQLQGVMQGDVLRGVLETSGGLKFGPDVVIAGEAFTRSEKDAAALADVVRFFVGLAQMSAQKDPKAAASLAFLQKLELTAQGNVMRMSLSIPEAELQKTIQQAIASAKRQAATAGKGAAPAPRYKVSPSRPSGDIVIQSSPKDMGTVVIKDR